MHVKRHLNRLFGSFRRKDHKNIGDVVSKQLQSPNRQTASRWELLDAEGDDFESVENIQPEDNWTNTTLTKSSKGISSSSFNEQEEGVSKGLSYFGSKWGSKRRKKDKTITAATVDITATENDINYKHEDLSSVVEEINNTIGLIGEFLPADFQQNRVKNMNTTIEVTIHHQNNEDVHTLSCIDERAYKWSSPKPILRQNVPQDDDSQMSLWPCSPLEGTRLTIYPSQSQIIEASTDEREREAINLLKSGSLGPFTTTTTTTPHQHSPSRNSGREIFLATARDDYSSSSGDDSHEVHDFSRYCTEDDDCDDGASKSNRPGAPQLHGRLSIVRRSGRRLYNKIHKTFKKKGNEISSSSDTKNNGTHTYTKTEPGNGVDVDTHTLQILKTNNLSRGGGSFIEKIPRRIHSSRLTQSFRRVIGKSPMFQELNNQHDTTSVCNLEQFIPTEVAMSSAAGAADKTEMEESCKEFAASAKKVLFPTTSLQNENKNYEIYEAIKINEWSTF